MQTLADKLAEMQAPGALPLDLPPACEYLWYLGARAAIELLVGDPPPAGDVLAVQLHEEARAALDCLSVNGGSERLRRDWLRWAAGVRVGDR